MNARAAKTRDARRLRILLADDHAILREGLAVLIAAEPDMEVIAQAGDGREAVRMAERDPPDVAVLDVSMPGMGGAQAAELIREQCPDTRVVALTRHADPGYLRTLLAAGAQGYVLKRSAAETLISAIRIVAQGGMYLEPSLAAAVVNRGKTAGSADETLSAREQDVLRAIAWGRSNKEIATMLGLSVKTIESYRSTATQKLGLRGRNAIVRYAMARGWLRETE